MTASSHLTQVSQTRPYANTDVLQNINDDGVPELLVSLRSALCDAIVLRESHQTGALAWVEATDVSMDEITSRLGEHAATIRGQRDGGAVHTIDALALSAVSYSPYADWLVAVRLVVGIRYETHVVTTDIQVACHIVGKQYVTDVPFEPDWLWEVETAVITEDVTPQTHHVGTLTLLWHPIVVGLEDGIVEAVPELVHRPFDDAYRLAMIVSREVLHVLHEHDTGTLLPHDAGDIEEQRPPRVGEPKLLAGDAERLAREPCAQDVMVRHSPLVNLGDVIPRNDAEVVGIHLLCLTIPLVRIHARRSKRLHRKMEAADAGEQIYEGIARQALVIDINHEIIYSPCNFLNAYRSFPQTIVAHGWYATTENAPICCHCADN